MKTLIPFCATALVLFGSAKTDTPLQPVLHEQLRIATFSADVTPPKGSPLCHGLVVPAETVVDRLSARGVVLLGAGKPIVLCAFDWVGIANESHDAIRAELASAAGTTPDRVAVHALHQHDAPGVDRGAERLLSAAGLAGMMSDPEFERAAFHRVADALRFGLERPRPISHIGTGMGRVEKVASNRRILGSDGKVAIVRFSSCKDPAGIAAPEGLVDPDLKMITYWDQRECVAALTFYATHPQSHYGKGGVSYDFVGMARQSFEQTLPRAMVIHFNGAGGNIAAGKYNDGSPENRSVLASRLQAGMQNAWANQQRRPIDPQNIRWATSPVPLAARSTLKSADLSKVLDDTSRSPKERIAAARNLAFLRRTESGPAFTLSALHFGDELALFLPSEIFVEYQLTAQNRRPGRFTAVAGYGDYGAGYIGVAKAYPEGGYETGPVSRVDERAEAALMAGIQAVLKGRP